MWFKLAAEQGHLEARVQLTALSSSTSPDEVAKGQRAHDVYLRRRAQHPWPGHPPVTDATYEEYCKRKLP